MTNLMFQPNYEFNEVLVLGLVGAVGGRLKTLSNILKAILEDEFEYEVEEIRVSTSFIEPLVNLNKKTQFKRYKKLMDCGNDLREKYGNGFISYKVIEKIYNLKKQKQNPLKKRKAFIINSLKHEEEIKVLRQVYGKSFFQISLYESYEVRQDVLINEIGMSKEQAIQLMGRDEGEKNDFGQHTREAFHLADYFIKFDNKNNNQIINSCRRFLELIFGNPYRTPTFNEFAMYMAFTSSLKSSDLSRQVGAVLTKDKNIIATGANDVPKFGGGQYWPVYIDETGEIEDIENGRDYKRVKKNTDVIGFDSNEFERNEIIDHIYKGILEQFDSKFGGSTPQDEVDRNKLHELIKKSPVKDITEYGRIVHAEMDALISCGRTNNSTSNSVLYVTTFPCHNCAKHIIAAGVEDVIFIEPYPKSKALSLWDDSAVLRTTKIDSTKLNFQPFVGVGPRSFLDLFSMSLGAGFEMKRKEKNNCLIDWKPSTAKLRLSTSLYSLREIETQIIDKMAQLCGGNPPFK